MYRIVSFIVMITVAGYLYGQRKASIKLTEVTPLLEKARIDTSYWNAIDQGFGSFIPKFTCRISKTDTIGEWMLHRIGIFIDDPRWRGSIRDDETCSYDKEK